MPVQKKYHIMLSFFIDSPSDTKYIHPYGFRGRSAISYLLSSSYTVYTCPSRLLLTSRWFDGDTGRASPEHYVTSVAPCACGTGRDFIMKVDVAIKNARPIRTNPPLNKWATRKTAGPYPSPLCSASDRLELERTYLISGVLSIPSEWLFTLLTARTTVW